jgi:hypothetical protein
MQDYYKIISLVECFRVQSLISGSSDIWKQILVQNFQQFVVQLDYFR